MLRHWLSHPEHNGTVTPRPHAERVRNIVHRCAVQVIEFYANGTAIEEYKPRTPQQLGLHPRDVVLFAPLSRLAAPQVGRRLAHSASWQTGPQ
jgi:hypothetical protein